MRTGKASRHARRWLVVVVGVVHSRWYCTATEYSRTSTASPQDSVGEVLRSPMQVSSGAIVQHRSSARSSHARWLAAPSCPGCRTRWYWSTTVGVQNNSRSTTTLPAPRAGCSQTGISKGEDAEERRGQSGRGGGCSGRVTTGRRRCAGAVSCGCFQDGEEAEDGDGDGRAAEEALDRTGWMYGLLS